MKTVLYRRWAPPQSSTRIEFPSDLIHDIRAQSRSAHDRGYLFGRREGAEVRVLTALREPQADDPRIAGLEPVGVYFVRARGEVFLTDVDLEQVDRVADGVAFVIAGARAGFFTREADGTMQAVRSYEEFLVADVAPLAEAPEALAAPLPLPRGRHPARPPVKVLRRAVGMAAALALPVAAFALLRPVSRETRMDLALRETNGQLVIRWDPSEPMRNGAHLDIADSGERTVIPIMPGVHSATYAARSGDIEIQLISGGRRGQVRWTSSRFLPPVPQTAAELPSQEEIREDLEQLQSQAAYLRQSIARRQAKVRELTVAADQLLAR